MAGQFLHIVDASTPPASAHDLPADTDGILLYMGKAGQTPHVASAGEWDRFAHLLQLGIYFPDLGANPVDEAKAAAEAAHQLGFAPFRGILLDFEANADPAFIGELGLKVREHHYSPIGYESQGVLAANPRLDGIVLAKPGAKPVVPSGQLIIGAQYRWDVPVTGGTLIDLSVWDSSTRHLFGRGPRK